MTWAEANVVRRALMNRATERWVPLKGSLDVMAQASKRPWPWNKTGAPAPRLWSAPRRTLLCNRSFGVCGFGVGPVALGWTEALKCFPVRCRLKVPASDRIRQLRRRSGAGVDGIDYDLGRTGVEVFGDSFSYICLRAPRYQRINQSVASTILEIVFGESERKPMALVIWRNEVKP